MAVGDGVGLGELAMEISLFGQVRPAQAFTLDQSGW